jgi:hypothetical protein
MSRAQERSTAIRAERVPTFSNPWGLLAITSTPGTGPKILAMDAIRSIGVHPNDPKPQMANGIPRGAG